MSQDKHVAEQAVGRVTGNKVERLHHEDKLELDECVFQEQFDYQATRAESFMGMGRWMWQRSNNGGPRQALLM